MVATVVLDTNVFTAWLKSRSTLVQRYGKHGGERHKLLRQTG